LKCLFFLYRTRFPWFYHTMCSLWCFAMNPYTVIRQFGLQPNLYITMVIVLPQIHIILNGIIFAKTNVIIFAANLVRFYCIDYIQQLKCLFLFFFFGFVKIKLIYISVSFICGILSLSDKILLCLSYILYPYCICWV
jgi:hypothetical protein